MILSTFHNQLSKIDQKNLVVKKKNTVSRLIKIVAYTIDFISFKNNSCYSNCFQQSFLAHYYFQELCSPCHGSMTEIKHDTARMNEQTNLIHNKKR